MNISPILLLTIGSTFALLYALIITFGWAVTRKNRKTYHDAVGYSEVELIDLDSFKPLGRKIKTVSLQNNFFLSTTQQPIDWKNYNCYIIEKPSPRHPQLQKGDLILTDPSTNKIKYAFKIPDLKDFR